MIHIHGSTNIYMNKMEEIRDTVYSVPLEINPTMDNHFKSFEVLVDRLSHGGLPIKEATIASAKASMRVT